MRPAMAKARIIDAMQPEQAEYQRDRAEWFRRNGAKRKLNLFTVVL